VSFALQAIPAESRSIARRVSGYFGHSGRSNCGERFFADGNSESFRRERLSRNCRYQTRSLAGAIGAGRITGAIGAWYVAAVDQPIS
jgi:hypothetical protein